MAFGVVPVVTGGVLVVFTVGTVLVAPEPAVPK